MDYPEGAGSQLPGRVDFDRRVRLELRGAQISSDCVRHQRPWDSLACLLIGGFSAHLNLTWS